MNNVIQQSKKYAILAFGIVFAGGITQSAQAFSYKLQKQNLKSECPVAPKDARIAVSSLCIAVSLLQFARENTSILNKLVLGTILASIGTAGVFGKEKTLIAIEKLRELAISGTETAVIYTADAFAYLSEAASSAIENMNSKNVKTATKKTSS